MSQQYRKLLRTRPRWQLAGWSFPVIASLIAVWICCLAVQASSDAQRWQTTLNATKSRMASRPVPPAPTRAALEEVRRWDALAAERAFSWYPVFRALEQASNSDIELLEFLPEKAGRRLTLRGEARDIGALSTYLTALRVQPPLSDIYLAQQKNIGRAGMMLLSFEIRARLGDAPAAIVPRDMEGSPKK